MCHYANAQLCNDAITVSHNFLPILQIENIFNCGLVQSMTSEISCLDSFSNLHAVIKHIGYRAREKDMMN